MNTAAPPRKGRFLVAITSWKVRIALALACAALGAGAWIGSDLRAGSPFDASIPFKNLRSVIVSRDGSMVVADSGERRLLGIDPAGNLSFVLPGERRTDGFYNGRPLGFDSLGRFYVDDTVMDLASSNTARRQVLRFDGTGKLLGTVARFEFSGEAMNDWESHPIYGQIAGDALYWFKKGGDGEWRLLSWPLVGEGQPSELALGFDAYDCMDIAAVSARELYVLGYDGAVSRWTPEGGLEDWLTDGSGTRYPVAMNVDAGGRLVIVDGKRYLRILDPDGETPALSDALSPEVLLRAGHPEPVSFQDACALPSGGFALGDEFSGSLIVVDAAGKLRSTHSIPLGGWISVAQTFSWLALIGTYSLIAVLVALSYLRLLAGRTQLVVKQLLVFMPIIALMVATVGFFVYSGMNSIFESQIRDRLLHLAQLGAGRSPVASIDALDYPKTSFGEAIASEDCGKAVAVLDELVNLNRDGWNASILPYVYSKRDGVWWILGSFDYLELYPYMRPEFDRVMAEAESVFFRYDDVYGAWLSACAPIVRPDGTVAAVFEASMSADIFDEAKRGYLWQAAAGGGAILAAFLAVFGAFTTLLLRSVRKLQAGADSVARGEFGVEIDIRSRDEIQDLGTAFNAMSREIRDQVESLARLGRANERFVPREFLEMLGRHSITEVGLGDQVLIEMAVLFSDIRDFTGLAEDLGPASTMDFLNDYLSRVGPAIRASGGFIDKYVGDSILALFPGGPDKALEAALAVSKAIDGFREDLASIGQRDMQAGIGVHTGQLMLGVIGEEERFDGTVIADAVNLASRIESLTKFYGVRVLTTGDAKEKLDAGKQLRFVDLARVKGKHRAVRLYELLRPEDPDRARKIAAAKPYIKAFEAYRLGRFEEAERGFAEALAICPGDRPAEILRARCVEFAKAGAPEAWEGITEFHEK